MASRRASRSNLNWPLLLLGMLIALGLGAFAATLTIGGGASIKSLARSIGATGGSAKSEDDPSLEREVDRLRNLVESKDREIAELTIQLKLLTEGSRSR